MNKQFGNMKPRSLIGLVMVALALLVFLNNIGIKLLGFFFGNWPVALVIIGAALLISSRKQQDNRADPLPYALIGLGIIFFMVQHGIFNLSFHAIVVPLALLVGGIYLLGPNKFCKGKHCGQLPWHMSCKDNNASSERASDNDLDGEKLNIYSVLGGGNYRSRSAELSSGNLICVLGGAEVDISDADMSGNEMELDVLAFMGGAELKIPPNWDVTVKMLPLLGGVSNKTTCLADKMGLPRKHLIITGVACMGGLDIRN